MRKDQWTGDHSFNTFAKFYKKTNISCPSYVCVTVCKKCFLENFANVLNK